MTNKSQLVLESLAIGFMSVILLLFGLALHFILADPAQYYVSFGLLVACGVIGFSLGGLLLILWLSTFKRVLPGYTRNLLLVSWVVIGLLTLISATSAGYVSALYYQNYQEAVSQWTGRS